MADVDPNRAKGKISLTVEIIRDNLSIKATKYRIKLGKITGYGKSMAECKVDFATRLERAIERLDTDPAFAVDDDGSLIVAVQESHGVVHWRVPKLPGGGFGQPRSITAADGTPRGSLEGTWHYSILDV